MRHFSYTVDDEEHGYPVWLDLMAGHQVSDVLFHSSQGFLQLALRLLLQSNADGHLKTGSAFDEGQHVILVLLF